MLNSWVFNKACFTLTGGGLNQASISNSQDPSREKLTELQAEPEGWWPKGRPYVRYNLCVHVAQTNNHRKHLAVGCTILAVRSTPTQHLLAESVRALGKCRLLKRDLESVLSCFLSEDFYSPAVPANVADALFSSMVSAPSLFVPIWHELQSFGWGEENHWHKPYFKCT